MAAIRLQLACLIMASSCAWAGSFGEIDTSFDITRTGGGPVGRVSALLVEDGGYLLIGGEFNQKSNPNFPRDGIARVDSTGALAPGFEASEGSSVLQIIKSERGYLVTQSNRSVPAHPALVRYTFEGRIDSSFRPARVGIGTATTVLPLKDGTILFSGDFSYFEGKRASGLVRLNSDGTLNNIPTIAYPIEHFLPMPSGKIYASAWGDLHQLNADGSYDKLIISFQFFDWMGNYYSHINALIADPNGSAVIGGLLGPAYERFGPMVGPLARISDFQQYQSLYGDSTSVQSLATNLRDRFWAIKDYAALYWFPGTLDRTFKLAGSYHFSAVVDGFGDLIVTSEDRVGYSNSPTNCTVLRYFAGETVNPVALKPSPSKKTTWEISGETNVTAFIETSLDLKNWTTVATNVLVSGSMQFSLAPTNRAGFMRVKRTR